MWHVGDGMGRLPWGAQTSHTDLTPAGPQSYSISTCPSSSVGREEHVLKKHFVTDNFLLSHFNNVHLFHLFALVLSGQPF